ncbi:MAG: hypothetical protein WAK17_09480 [Candidatus Nitrosopolaris sp.]
MNWQDIAMERNRVGNDTMAWFQSLSAHVTSAVQFAYFWDIGNSRNSRLAMQGQFTD